ncbi:6-carboxytetrahydropterin synthase [Oceanobacter sp. 3_MG-2023]|uniref:6-pyruvoyl trahydropterin synthase family protein n=1 Tax=Oceanobacter sp. 3_MG-2023 TaxID=3062622 RepID=UPI00273452EC|nr:6-carboxytetrahydropterin synthase [Oceanobacter sp. 3_MG-2023]MDP2504156.1 6-carboxytetrahydropterin synthase [Oceanobacter sp. 3_MG-2023]
MQLFVNQLTNVDFSYLDAQRGLVGETWLASVILDGILDEQGMVCDFGIVKQTLRYWLDEQLDHRLLVPAHSDRLEYRCHDGRITLTWHADQGDIELDCPADAVTLITTDCITATSTSAWCREQLKASFPVNVDQLTLTFEPERIDSAFYHYSHGLKKHNGNCQRIAHGHRSRIEIFCNGERSDELEQQWAQRWRDIYIGTSADLVANQEEGEGTGQHKGRYHFAYDAPQGHFELTLPQSQCYLINTDTTVELIAEHLASTIATGLPGQHILVRAYEGINKGAIAQRPQA